VAKYFADQGYELVERRFRTPYAEIDLILKHPQSGWLLVEVKSVVNFDWLGPVVTARQAKRLMEAYEWYCERETENVSIQLAVVSQDDEVFVFEDGLMDLLTP